MNSSLAPTDDPRFTLVRDRLAFVQLITGMNAQLRDPKAITETDDGGWSHPWMYFDALRNYLLLTCFDLLGHQNDFVDFGNWVQSKKYQSEFDDAERATAPVVDLKSRIHQIHAKYIEIYGVKRSFFRFIFHVIPPSARADLLFNIKIEQTDPQNHQVLETINDEQRKAEFLYWIRNAYTHSAINTGTPAGGVFEGFDQPVMIDGKPMKGYVSINHRIIGNRHYEISARDWPFALQRAVEAGLASFDQSPAT